MKSSRFVKFAAVSGFVLLSPVLTFAGGQPKVQRTPSKEELQDRTGIARAIQQGKGGGMSLSNAALNANAFRSQTPAESALLKSDPPRAQRPNYSDPAFTK
jgi:hypothetical protein